MSYLDVHRNYQLSFLACYLHQSMARPNSRIRAMLDFLLVFMSESIFVTHDMSFSNSSLPSNATQPNYTTLFKQISNRESWERISQVQVPCADDMAIKRPFSSQRSFLMYLVAQPGRFKTVKSMVFPSVGDRIRMQLLSSCGGLSPI